MNDLTNVYDQASRVKEVVLQDGAKVLTDYGVSVSGVIRVTKTLRSYRSLMTGRLNAAISCVGPGP